MREVEKVSLFDVKGQMKVNNILYECGKYMASTYNLHHWDNSRFKNVIIILLCLLKNDVFLVFDEGKEIATFQTKKINDVLRFEKLATRPNCMSKGIGSFCLEEIEKQAKSKECKRIRMEVYSPSVHAVDFYIHRGFAIVGEKKTLKYSEFEMERKI